MHQSSELKRTAPEESLFKHSIRTACTSVQSDLFFTVFCCLLPRRHVHGVQRRMISVVNVFVFLRIIIFCFVVAICDLVHDVKAIFHFPYVLTASGNLF